VRTQGSSSGKPSLAVTRLLAVLDATWATMTIDVPEGEPEPPQPEIVYSPEQIAERTIEAARHRDVIEQSRALGLFNYTKWAP
jgi:hypothetical protein